MLFARLLKTMHQLYLHMMEIGTCTAENDEIIIEMCKRIKRSRKNKDIKPVQKNACQKLGLKTALQLQRISNGDKIHAVGNTGKNEGNKENENSEVAGEREDKRQDESDSNDSSNNNDEDDDDDDDDYNDNDNNDDDHNDNDSQEDEWERDDDDDDAKESQEDCIIKITLQCESGSQLGFRIEGGSDTVLKYICIKALLINSPAYNCGMFRNGDQLVMVGDTCLIGVTYDEATQSLKQAPAIVQVIAQRKRFDASLTRTCEHVVGRTGYQLPGIKKIVVLRCDPGEMFGISITGGTDDPYLKYIHVRQLIPDGVAGHSRQIENGDCIISVNGHNLMGLSKSEALKVLRGAGNHVILVINRLNWTSNPKPVNSDYHKSADKAHCSNVITPHMNFSGKNPLGESKGKDLCRTTPVCLHTKNFKSAKHQNKAKRYRNDNNTQNDTLHKDHGRQRSETSKDDKTTLTQFSNKDSRARSIDYSHVESWRIAQQWSPHNAPHISNEKPHEEREATTFTPGPANTKKRHQRDSVNTKGEILTFTNEKSTLPRKITGSRFGVHLVELHKEAGGYLGIQLQGGEDASTPITVKTILKGGAAYKSGRIHEGDEIIEVNGIAFARLSLQETLRVMKSLPPGKVSLIMRKHHYHQESKARNSCQRKLFGDDCLVN